MEKIAAVIFASGKGTRMKSETPKVLHELHGKAMIDHVYDLVKEAGIADIFVTVGYKKELVMEHLGDKVGYVFQDEPQGTGEALQKAYQSLKQYEKVFVICGDTPLFSPKTVTEMMESDADMILASSILSNPTGFGRIVKEGDRVVDVIEEKDATDDQRKIKEINAGCYAFKTDWLKEALPRLTKSSVTGEYYITELPKIAAGMGKKVTTYVLDDHKESFGINSKEHLDEAHKLI